MAILVPSHTPCRTAPSPWLGRAPRAAVHAAAAACSGRRGQHWPVQARARGFSPAAAEIRKGRRSGDRDDGARSNGGGGDEEDDAIPQVVFDRMVRRVAASVAAPMAGGVGLLWAMSTVDESGAWDVPAWLPFVTTVVCFGTSALGITYGTLSASWDPEREGSLLGWGEVRRNWPELWKEDDDGEQRG